MRLHQVSRVIFGSYMCALCNEPEQPSAAAAIAELKRITRMHQASPDPGLWYNNKTEEIEKFEAQFDTPDALEAFVAEKLAAYKRSAAVGDFTGYLVDTARVIREHPDLVKHVDLERIQKLASEIGPIVPMTSQEKIDFLVKDGYTVESAKDSLERFNNDLFEVLAYYMTD